MNNLNKDNVLQETTTNTNDVEMLDQEIDNVFSNDSKIEPSFNTNDTKNEDSDSNISEIKEKLPNKNTTKDEETQPTETDTQTSLPQRRSALISEKRKREKERKQRNLERESLLSLWEQFKTAHARHMILKGTVGSIEIINHTKVCAVVYIDQFEITIPFEEFFETYPLDLSTATDSENILNRERQMLLKSIGANITFIILDMNFLKEGNTRHFAIVASRRAAIKKMRAINYDKNRRSAPRFQIGDEIEANILSVGYHALYLDLLGKDKSVPMRNISYKYIENAADEYHTGETITMTIRDLIYDEDGHLTDIQVDNRKSELQKFIPNLKRIKIGSCFIGKVVNVRESKTHPGKIVINLFLENVNVPAVVQQTQFTTMTEPIVVGDDVIFETRIIKENVGIVLGNIIRKKR